MVKVLVYAFNRQGFFIEGLVPHFMAPAGNLPFVSSLRINMPNPACITVAGRADEDIRAELSK